MKINETENYGKKLRDFRILKGIKTTTKMSEVINTAQTVISYWERSEKPPIQAFIEYANYFNASISDILDLESNYNSILKFIPEDDLNIFKTLYERIESSNRKKIIEVLKLLIEQNIV